ncbi:hypothetical protein OAC85_02845, partial [Flavobacteriaceae bacterium]|nr:hypothetical protein [Flavobacteriaceae bacterium]
MYFLKTIRIPLVFLLLLSFQTSYTQFSFTNSTITQTGNATTLDNIENKANAYEEYSFGTLQGQTLTYRRAVLNGRNLIVQGTMTLNPDPDALNQDELFLGPSSPDNTIVVQNGGELILGGFVTNPDGSNRVANGTALRAFLRGALFYQNGGLTIQNGGKLTQIGATLLTDAAVRVEPGGIVNLINANWASTRRHTTRGGGLGPLFRLETDQITANGWTVAGQRLNILTDNLNQISLTGLVLEGANLLFQSVSSSSNSWTTIEDFGGFIGGGTLTIWGRQYGIKFLNAKDGGNVPTSPSISLHSNGSILETAATVKFDVTNSLGNPIENALVFGKAIDHVLPSAVVVPTGMDFPNQNGTYSELTSAVGETSAIEVKINYGYLNSSVVRELLWRSNTNNTEDFVLYHYAYNSAEVNVDLLGTGLKTVPWTLFDDLSISETNRVTVDGYATIDNLDQLYDRAKSWKVNTANIEFPSINQLLLTTAGTVLNTGDYDLNLDDTAGSVFAVDTGNQTITVKTTALVASTQFSSLQSSGTISFANNATLEAGYQDSTGTYAYVELTGMDQQDLAITAMNAGVSSTLLRLSNFSGTYKGHVQLPSLTASITALATRDGFAPWADMLPIGDLLFQREVSTSPSSVTGSNQQLMIQLIYKLLQKTEALS